MVALVAASDAARPAALFAPEKTRAARGMELALQDDAVFVSPSYRSDASAPSRTLRPLGVTRLRVNLCGPTR